VSRSMAAPRNLEVETKPKERAVVELWQTNNR